MGEESKIAGEITDWMGRETREQVDALFRSYGVTGEIWAARPLARDEVLFLLAPEDALSSERDHELSVALGNLLDRKIGIAAKLPQFSRENRVPLL